MCEAHAEMNRHTGRPIQTNFQQPNLDMFEQGLQNLSKTIVEMETGVVAVTDLAARMEDLKEQALNESQVDLTRPHWV